MALNKFSQYPERTQLNPVPRVDQTKLVAVTNTTSTDPSEDILVQARELLPGVAFNSDDGNPRPMVSGVVWNEQEQLREAFTEGDAFTLPHFRYVADDYFWKSIVGDKAFYYLTNMDLVTWPLAWTPPTINPALHLEWLRAPEQTQIFKFTDATPNSTWTAPSSYGAIILQNRTLEMVSWDPMEVRVNECSTSTKLKEVRVVVKSKDASPLYINFPGADVSVTIPQLADTAVTPNVTSTLAAIQLTSDTTSDCAWRTFTLNTAATTLKDSFNVSGTNICHGIVYVNAPSVTSIDNCFQNLTEDGTEGDFSADIRLALPKWNQSLTLGVNNNDTTRGIAIHPAAVKYLFENLDPNALNGGVVTVGIDIRAFMGEFKTTMQEVEAAAATLVAGGKWTINYVPIDHRTGTTVFEPGNIDAVWNIAKAGAFDGTNLNMVIGDVVLCYGNATLPGAKVLPESIRFASDKQTTTDVPYPMASAFKNNTSVKYITDTYFAENSYPFAWLSENSSLLTVNINVTKPLSSYMRLASNPWGASQGKIQTVNIHFSLPEGTLINAGYLLSQISYVCTSASILSDTNLYITDAGLFAYELKQLSHLYIDKKIKFAPWSVYSKGSSINNSTYKCILDTASFKDWATLILRSNRSSSAYYLNNTSFSVGIDSAIADGSLATEPHKEADGTESANQWSVEKDGVTYYANGDLWTCCQLLKTTDILELDGTTYTGIGFGDNFVLAFN